MKKNILLVQSFLIVPLLTSSLSFSMDTPKTYADVVQKTAQQSLKNSGTKKRNRKKKQPAQQQQQELSQPVAEKTELTEAESKAAERQAIALARTEAIKKRVEESITDEDKANAKTDLEFAKKNINLPQDLCDILSTIRRIGAAQVLNPVSIVSAIEQAPTPINMDDIKIKVAEDLEDSILSPSERIDFGVTQRIWNSWKSYRTITIDLLTNKNFDVNNATHTEYFNQALEECAQQKDRVSLEAIMKACQAEEYKTSMQSAINHVAPVFNFLCNEYQAQVSNSNTTLVAYNQQCAEQMNQESARLRATLTQLLNQHRDTVSAMSQHFGTKIEEEKTKVESLSKLICDVSNLNRKVSSRENNLFFAFPLNVPTNSVGKIEEKTHQNVRHLLTHSNMPQAKTDILQISNK